MSPIKRSGFTLIELLVVIAIIGILCALLFPSLQAARNASNRTAEISNLRQIGVAIQSYANDHGQYLPGPLSAGQSPSYSTSTSGSSTLGFQLWQYIGASQPTAVTQQAAILSNPAYARYCTANPSAAPTCPSYIMNEAVSIATSGTAQNPWGAASSGTPLKIVTISTWKPSITGTTWKGTSDLWAMQNVDQANALAALGGSQSPGWFSVLPATPLNANFRIKMYFDWHVEARPATEIP